MQFQKVKQTQVVLGYVPYYVLIIALALIVLDQAIPLPKTPYVWEKWIFGTNLGPGMTDYFPAKVINEAVIEKDKNYMISGHPHGLW